MNLNKKFITIGVVLLILGPVNVLPNFIGYILIYSALKGLKSSTKSMKKALYLQLY